MDITNRYVLDFALRHASSRRAARILDYGCGAGHVVRAGLAAGLDIYGADVYYGGSDSRIEAQAGGLLGVSIREIHDGKLDFPDQYFSLVVNNQVMEHVEDLDAVLREIHRVLEWGGQVLSIFPSRDVFREGHIGIPFAHWFRRESRLRFYYTWLLRGLGLGYWKQQAPSCRQWAVDKLRWIDTYTRYRSRGEIFDAYNRYFRNEFIEPDYICYRLRAHPALAFAEALMALPGLPGLARAVFRKLAFLVIVSHKVKR